MRWEELLSEIVKNAGAAGVRELEDALGEISENAESPWQKALLRVTGDAVERYGLEGVCLVQGLVWSARCGKVPDLGFVSLKHRSDALAALQNIEADDKTKAHDFMIIVGEQVGVILKAILKGLAG